MKEKPYDDLTQIEGIKEGWQRQLRQSLGVRTYQDLADLSSDEIRSGLKPSPGKSRGEAWIRQAQELATASKSSKWKTDASFVVDFQSRTTETEGEQRQTKVHHMEKDKNAEWPGIKNVELCRWMLKQMGETDLPELAQQIEEIRIQKQRELEQELEEQQIAAQRELEQALDEERSRGRQALKNKLDDERTQAQNELEQERIQAWQVLKRELDEKRTQAQVELERKLEEKKVKVRNELEQERTEAHQTLAREMAEKQAQVQLELEQLLNEQTRIRQTLQKEINDEHVQVQNELEQERKEAQQALEHELDKKRTEAQRKLEQSLEEDRIQAQQALQKELDNERTLARKELDQERTKAQQALARELNEKQTQAEAELAQKLAEERTQAQQTLQHELDEEYAQARNELELTLLEEESQLPLESLETKPQLQETPGEEFQPNAQVPELQPAQKQHSTLAVTHLRTFQPVGIAEPVAVGAPGRPFSGLINSDELFAFVIDFELAEPAKPEMIQQGMTYQAQFYMRNLATGAKEHLGNTKAIPLVEGKLSYSAQLTDVTLESGIYELTVLVAVQNGLSRANYLVVPLIQVA